MKYLVLLIDGMADFPLQDLNGKTPLEVASKPCMDRLAKKSELGILHVTPDGCNGGSEVGNLSILGYDPRKYLTGRAPIEAASIGIKMNDTDLAVRCNLVCLGNEPLYENKTMKDYSAGEITTAEADKLIKALNDEFAGDFLEFHTGISYRHCLILHNATDKMQLTPPHNISGQKISDHLPCGDYSTFLRDMMKKSYMLLKDHPVNRRRESAGVNSANSIWLWGQGRRMSLPSFSEKYGKKGAVITAVDLIKGIARCAGMEVYEVEGATGTLRTNFEGKACAAVQAFRDGNDFVYLHLEAPDECGHHGDVSGKVQAAEIIDKKVLSHVFSYLVLSGEPFRILVTPDHPTPLSTRGHSSADVPYMIYDSMEDKHSGISCYCEKTCASVNNYEADVLSLLDRFMK